MQEVQTRVEIFLGGGLFNLEVIHGAGKLEEPVSQDGGAGRI